MSSWTLGKVLRRWSCKDWWIDVWERKKAAWASGRLDLQLTQTETPREAAFEGKIKSSVSTYQVWCDYCTCNWIFQVDKWIYMSGNQKRGLGRKDIFWLSALRWHWRCHKTTCDHLNCECKKGKEETPKVSLEYSQGKGSWEIRRKVRKGWDERYVSRKRSFHSDITHFFLLH